MIQYSDFYFCQFIKLNCCMTRIVGLPMNGYCQARVPISSSQKPLSPAPTRKGGSKNPKEQKVILYLQHNSNSIHVSKRALIEPRYNIDIRTLNICSLIFYSILN